MAPNVLVVFEGTRRLVHVTKWHYTCTSGNTPPGKYTYLNTQSPAYIHIYFWEYTSREIRVNDTITGNSQTHIHSPDSLISSGNGLPGNYVLNTHKIQYNTILTGSQLDTG
ncbi:hypothetical protein DPMN_180055 [Dreissena polymorpha]|uniref:Uncharacterized protein n=1 Tax=Dreissena polymorpha TaxID=45954 RepID=A0A9D4EHD5_DREPO|nr:hypothetical protein DPMN_180055 [Dreissena polymorpha]